MLASVPHARSCARARSAVRWQLYSRTRVAMHSIESLLERHTVTHHLRPEEFAALDAIWLQQLQSRRRRTASAIASCDDAVDRNCQLGESVCALAAVFAAPRRVRVRRGWLEPHHEVTIPELRQPRARPASARLHRQWHLAGAHGAGCWAPKFGGRQNGFPAPRKRNVLVFPLKWGAPWYNMSCCCHENPRS